MTSAAPPRAFKEVLVAEKGDGFAVTLDGRQARTPGGAPLILPTRRLAEIIRAEWQALGASLDWRALPLTRLASPGLDGAEEGRARAAATLRNYAGADLLCYFADGPSALVERQQHVWGELLDWARRAHGLAFERARGIVHRDQPEALFVRLEEVVSARDAFHLSGLAFGAALLGSTILALALEDARLDAAAAVAAARLDEAFQEEIWGIDAEAALRTERLHAEARLLESYFRALSAGRD